MNDSNYRTRRNNLLNIIGGGKCFICGSIDRLQFHHIYGNGDIHGVGGNQGLKQLEEDFDKYLKGDKTKELVVLCRDCHIDIHSQQLKKVKELLKEE